MGSGAFGTSCAGIAKTEHNATPAIAMHSLACNPHCVLRDFIAINFYFRRFRRPWM
jgi:hypothetical protein